MRAGERDLLRDLCRAGDLLGDPLLDRERLFERDFAAERPRAELGREPLPERERAREPERERAREPERDRAREPERERASEPERERAPEPERERERDLAGDELRERADL